MMNTTRRRFPVPILFASLLALGCEDDKCAKVRPFPTSTKIAEPGLILRMANDRESVLMLALGSSETPSGRLRKSVLNEIVAKRKILVYKQGAQRLDIVDGRLWDTGLSALATEASPWARVDNDIVVCAAQLDSTTGKPLRFDGSAKTLLFDEKILPTAGRSALRANLSPDRKYVAALSAEGAYDDGWFSGGSQASGKRFHQVFRCADGTQIGETVILSDAPEKDVMNQCWSPDGRWVVYDDANFERVWIVPGVQDDARDKKP